jgi:hypothetical protein
MGMRRRAASTTSPSWDATQRGMVTWAGLGVREMASPVGAVGWESSRYAVVLSLEGEGLWRPAVSEHLHPLPEAREGLGGV